MYIVDFFKSLNRKSNIPVIIYLVLNVFVIAGIIYLLFMKSGIKFWMAFLIGIGAYAISLLIALSPFGEWILRMQNGCRKLKRVDQINYIEPIFREVYEKAKALDPSISDDVRLFINDDETPNAFATGRKTICITEGLLQLPEDQIKATLGHEFGHLAHKDTDLILVVSVGNFIVTAIIFVVRIVIDVFHIIFGLVGAVLGGAEGLIMSLINGLYHLLIMALVSGLTWVWTKIGVLLVMKSRRENEYEADEFSFNLGYGKELCTLLDSICGSGRTSGLFANLASSHPDKDDRIARLQALGATYRTTYGADVPQQNYVAQSTASAPAAAMAFSSGPMNIPAPSRLICPACNSMAEEDDAMFCMMCGTRLNH